MSLPYVPYERPSSQVTLLGDWSDGTGIFVKETNSTTMEHAMKQKPRLIRQYASYIDESDGWGTVLPIRRNMKDGGGYCLQKPAPCPVQTMGWCDVQKLNPGSVQK